MEDTKIKLRLAETIRVAYLNGKSGLDMQQTVTEMRDVALSILQEAEQAAYARFRGKAKAVICFADVDRELDEVYNELMGGKDE